ncbi:glycosyltransferase [Rhizosaccharibacter radicis]|uniref:Glycosyltransferase n=1 Tax=Rhizosaccharibacter radicis TaxID=2782605 RepID=A0ABT1VT64_9PROT|nr:glycosyltransferase [Acetobacteraceae bacterium KSS12]
MNSTDLHPEPDPSTEAPVASSGEASAGQNFPQATPAAPDPDRLDAATVSEPLLGDPPDGSASQAEVPEAPLWQRFDPVFYAKRYAAVLPEALSPEELERFYWDQGAAAGHSPNPYFDESWYLSNYRDIAAHVAAGGARSGFDHYCHDGYRDRAPHWLFDENYYRRVNPDLTASALEAGGFRNGYHHYLVRGDGEFRSGHRFFAPDLLQQGGRSSRDGRGPFVTLLLEGFALCDRQRLSWYFDPQWYLEQNGWLRRQIEDGRWSCGLHHFLCNDTPRAFDGSRWFSELFYVAAHPDIASALDDGAFRNGYEHFLAHGVQELRTPHPDADLVAYHANRQVQLELDRHEFPDIFAHWVARHEALAREAMLPALDERQSKRLALQQAENMLLQYTRRPLDFACSDAEPRVSVIMVLFNQFALTMAALSSLRAVHTGDIDLVLVDSGSRDETRQIDRFVVGARILRMGFNAGFIECCNRALEQVRGRAVLFLNNDLTLGHNALFLALKRLEDDDTVGAVGGKIIRTNGQLQEAGCIIWRDGSTMGYLRDEHPDLPEANFVRDVDFCSGAFLLIRSALLRQLGGFDEAFKPAYYEETDLCVRLRRLGHRIVYDPAVVIQHMEYGSSGTADSTRMIQRNHEVFVRRHMDWLRFQYPPRLRNAIFARSPRDRRRRILFFEDRVPMRHLGSGYVRSNDIVRMMAELGHHVTVFPVYAAAASPVEVFRDFPDTVEVIYDRGLDQLREFLEQRAGYYDAVWIGRTHNLPRLLPILGDMTTSLPDSSFVLDTEAVAAPRLVGQARLLGLRGTGDLDALLREEFAVAYFCQKIIAVNEADAALIRSTGHGDVSVLGHMVTPCPTPRTWSDRSGLLFLGAFHDEASPNYDSIRWFNAEVLPLLRDRLPASVRFTVAGYVDQNRVDMVPLGLDPRVDLLGPVQDLRELYDRHRVFVAPTRFAGGIPFKVHEAAAHGVPVVATALLCRQVGWTDGDEIMSGGTDDPARFAEAILSLYEDEGRWNDVRRTALSRIEQENTEPDYRRRISDIMDDVFAAGRQRGG